MREQLFHRKGESSHAFKTHTLADAADIPVLPHGQNTLPLERKAGQVFEHGSFRTSFLFPPASRQGAPSPRDRDKQKETAVPVAKHIDSVPRTLYLLGCSLLWPNETSCRSQKYEHKKCPMLCRTSFTARGTSPFYVFSDCKGKKKSRISKEIRDYFAKKSHLFYNFRRRAITFNHNINSFFHFITFSARQAVNAFFFRPNR